jgi:CubicO group peptidase (beta-lactamase class C family)
MLLPLVSLLTLAFQTRHQDRIDRLVRQAMASHRIPSAAIAVVRNGRVLKAAGYGPASLELQVPAGPHTLFEIGSITKQFTAVAVLQLVAAGKLELDAPFARYLDSVPEPWRAITLRQLLSHTSGIPDWEEGHLLDFRRSYSVTQFMEVMAAHPLGFAPGSRWAYSNSTFPLLGAIVARVSGESWEAYVTEHLLEPAGMTETRFRHNDQVIPNRAAGYVDSAGKFWSGEPRRPELLLPNGGILSSAVDIAKWCSALTNGKVLKPELLKLMTTPVHLSDGTSFDAGGIGWFLSRWHGHRVWAHNGVTPAGFSSVIYHYPDDGLSVVVLFSIDRGAFVNDLATELADLVIPGLAQKH